MTDHDRRSADEEAFSSSVVLEQTAAAPESLLASPDQLSQDEITRRSATCTPEYDAPRGRRRMAAGDDVGLPAVPLEHPAASHQESATRRSRDDRDTSPAFGQRDVAAIESNLTIQHSGEPHGRADDGARAPARLLGPSDREPADRTVAGQRRRSLHPSARPASRPARPELHRRRPRDHERRRRIPVHDDQARGPTRGRTT